MTELGNPCQGGKANITFDGQSTFVLPIAFTPKGKPEIRWHDAWSIR